MNVNIVISYIFIVFIKFIKCKVIGRYSFNYWKISWLFLFLFLVLILLFMWERFKIVKYLFGRFDLFYLCIFKGKNIGSFILGLI